ncbi:hypothetical protein cauri_0865 [Corynebacterium aurimucosum ATCC 700975]|uniref:Uncharacterized protein n=1 Tax=Corynebacterium aurimucosum (strain ATCC 700975 / DSM 44827 / CIP 107346 / CN-1) TaxID=548476 RepID=C3PF58_CORA7|nr:hypothetical protein [Corynebacterium aurimucosum]ACP32462.1 hypothetical protein cauri_0865 [Corynebacterium aurimucosum ATCC 700975]QQU93357.1 hypothetical protein I6I67_01310 [Corynebacterium aurimucosum]
MGLFSAVKDVIDRLGGSSTVRLASPDPHAVGVSLDHLSVHTASGLIILVTSPAGAQVLSEVARSGEPAQLRGPQTTVHLLATAKEQRPVHDPKKGWAIPLSPAEREILSQLTAEPGDYEVSEALAVSIENIPKES